VEGHEGQGSLQKEKVKRMKKRVWGTAVYDLDNSGERIATKIEMREISKARSPNSW
jgi:hypothetical protein